MHTAKLLLDESPLVVLPTLAESVGLNASIVLQQIHFFVLKKEERQDTRTYREGHYWVYNSFEEWEKVFRFWKLRTIKSIFSKVEKLGLVISKKFGKTKWDQKKWYRIDYEVLDRLVTDRAKSARSIVQSPHDQLDKSCTIDRAKSARSIVQNLHHDLKDQRPLTKTSYKEKESTHAKTQVDNTNTKTLEETVEVAPSISPPTKQNSTSSEKQDFWKNSPAAPDLPSKNSIQRSEEVLHPKAIPWQCTSSPNTIDQGFAEFVFQKVVLKADYWRDKNPTIADARQWILKARYREERSDQCWLRWQEYQEYLKRQLQVQTPSISPIPDYLQEPPPDLSWLRDRIQQTKQEGHPYVRAVA